MLIGTVIGIIALALLALAFAICWAFKSEHDDEYSQVVELRISAMAPPIAPDHEGVVLPFIRRG